MLECVVNLSEGRRPGVVAEIAATAGDLLLDVHSDADHNRSVLTLAGPGVEVAARHVAEQAVNSLDLASHEGAHPRLGVVDVVPFVPLEGASFGDALGARNRFAAWASSELSLPCFLYGPERTLPDVRRRAFGDLLPDYGPPARHPTAGACAVGARPVMVAYNLWLAGDDLESARRAAARLRGPAVRALAFALGGRVQLSFNLIDPATVGPADVHAAASSLVPVEGAELVGLVPASVLEATPADRWDELDLSPDRTIEARLRSAGLA
ncbi:MAG TPA: hypothetical protein VFH45_01745 [Acidimicrobiales bacterium]|nr:hypothetical protein [Acidimicrobiales bacterium]